MHSEFYSWLRVALSELPGSVAPSGAEDTVTNFTAFEVTDCPYPEVGVLSTNLAFTLSKKLLTGEPPREVVPEVIANTLCARGGEQGSEFRLVVGGGGFLNATPSVEAFCRYLSEIIFGSGELYGVAPLFPGESRGLHLPDAPNFYEKGLRNLLSRREEAPRFLGAPRSARERDDAIMLLSILADSELDTGAYRRGLYGSENIPWYLERFAADYSRIGISLNTEDITLFASPIGQGLADPSIRWTLRTREVIAQAALFGRPDLIFSHLLLGVRRFYQLFNRPEARTELRSKEVLETAVFGAIVKKFLNSTVPRLEICCETLRSVLHP